MPVSDEHFRAEIEEIIPPAPVAPEVTPEELFRKHVQEVQANGDAFDKRPTLYKPFNAVIGAAVTLVSAATVQAEHVAGSALTWTIITGIGVPLGDIIANIRGNTEAKQARARYNESTQTANNAHYELYRSAKRPDGKHSIAMRWFGPKTNEEDATAVEEFTRIAQLAQESGVDSIIVNPSMVIPRNAGPSPGTKQSMADWLAKTKKILTKGETEVDIVTEATPKEWLEYLETIPPVTITKKIQGSKVKIGVYAPLHSGANAAASHLIGSPPNDTPVTLYEIDPDSTETITVQETIREPIKPSNQLSVQKHIAAKESQPGDTRILLSARRRIIGGLLGGIVGVAAAAGQLGSDELLHHRDQQAAEQIARENGVDPKNAYVDPGSVRHRVDSWAGINRAWGWWRDERGNFYDQFNHPGDYPETSTGNILGGDVGNADKIDITPAWYLAPHNLPDSALQGHWEVGTANTLTATRYNGDVRISWDTFQAYYQKDKWELVNTLPAASARYREWIDVTRDINRLDKLILPPSTYIEIPVLEGYGVVAATLNGKPVQTYKKEDGTFVLELVGEQAREVGKLNYRIVKTGTKGARATRFVTVKKDDRLENLTYDQAAVQRAFARDVPQLDGATPQEFADYTHDNLTYSLSPWPKNELKKVRGVDQLVDLTFKQNKEICNVGVFVMALAYTNQINPVFEFANKGDLRVLRYSEAHARAVDFAGDKYDPTPASPPVAFVDKPEAPAPLPILPFAVTASSLILGGWMILKRKAIAKQAQRAGHWGFEHATAGTLRAAVAATDHAIWGRDGSTVDRQVLARARKDRTVSGKQAFATLKRPERHTPEMRQALKQQPAVTIPMRTALRAAQRASRRARK